MKIIVTGGAGFLGSHLCDKLLELGHTVYAVDNLITGSRDNIKHLENNPDFHFIEHDVSEINSEILRRFAPQDDANRHFATGSPFKKNLNSRDFSIERS